MLTIATLINIPWTSPPSDPAQSPVGYNKPMDMNLNISKRRNTSRDMLILLISLGIVDTAYGCLLLLGRMRYVGSEEQVLERASPSHP